MTTAEVLQFLAECPKINFLLGDPVKTGRISATPLFLIFIVGAYTILILAALLGRLLKKKWTLPTRLLKSPVDFVRSPIEKVINFSSTLLRDPIEAHYEGIDKKKWIKKYWLHAVGAGVVILISYCFGLCFLELGNGVKLETLVTMISGDYNQRAALLKTYVGSNPLLNSTVLVVVYTAMLALARVRYLETEHWNKQKSGLAFSVPVSTWDETPKFTKPEAEFLKDANDAVLRIIGSQRVDLIRIKVASGFDCFGSQGFLVDLLRRPNKPWRILMMNPDSEGARRRANQYFSERAADRPPELRDAAHYLSGIKETVNRVLEIKRTHNPNIEVRLYDHTPQWRLIFALGYAIVKGFAPGQRSDSATVNIFETKSTSLYHSFIEMFEDIWHHDSQEVTTPYDLTAP